MGPSRPCPSTAVAADPAQKMDRMYRWTRHVYDLTRRYYLLGRDRLLDRIARRPAGRVLEVGCGTARNLRVLHETAPHHTLYGLDASSAMLDTARSALPRSNGPAPIALRHGLAEKLDPSAQFGDDRPFDVIFFSYALSMIPSWPAALGRALSHLAPDGRLYIVDFWDQARLPDWVGTLLRQWLELFDVTPRAALLPTLCTLDKQGVLSHDVEPIARRYAHLITIELSGSTLAPQGSPASRSAAGSAEAAPPSPQ
ncbi:MAG: class I SAM-dependent methyltransferase [Salinibacter sp.]